MANLYKVSFYRTLDAWVPFVTYYRSYDTQEEAAAEAKKQIAGHSAEAIDIELDQSQIMGASEAEDFYCSY